MTRRFRLHFLEIRLHFLKIDTEMNSLMDSAQSLQIVGSNVSTSSGTWVTYATTLSQAPNNGFTSQSLQVSIYSSIFRALTIDPRGNLGIMDLTDPPR